MAFEELYGNRYLADPDYIGSVTLDELTPRRPTSTVSLAKASAPSGWKETLAPFNGTLSQVFDISAANPAQRVSLIPGLQSSLLAIPPRKAVEKMTGAGISVRGTSLIPEKITSPENYAAQNIAWMEHLLLDNDSPLRSDDSLPHTVVLHSTAGFFGLEILSRAKNASRAARLGFNSVCYLAPFTHISGGLGKRIFYERVLARLRKNSPIDGIIERLLARPPKDADPEDIKDFFFGTPVHRTPLSVVWHAKNLRHEVYAGKRDTAINSPLRQIMLLAAEDTTINNDLAEELATYLRIPCMKEAGNHNNILRNSRRLPNFIQGRDQTEITQQDHYIDNTLPALESIA